MGDDTTRSTDDLTDAPADEQPVSTPDKSVPENGTTETVSNETDTRKTTPPTPPTTDTDEDDERGDEAERTAATVIVENEPIIIDPETTAAELRAMTNANNDDLLTFRPAGGDQTHQIDEDERVLDHVDPGAQLAFQPVGSGPLFG